MGNTAELKQAITCSILEILKKDEFKKQQIDKLTIEIESMVISNGISFFQTDACIDVKNASVLKIKKLGKSEKVKNEIFNFMNNKLQEIEKSNMNFADVVPPSFVNGIKVYVYNDSGSIAASIKTFVNNNKSQKRIKEEIQRAIKSLNPMAAKFINADKIHYKIMLSINNYFDNPDNIMDIVLVINEFIDKLIENKISNFTLHIPTEGKNALIISLSNAIVDNLFSDAVINNIILKVEEKLNNKEFMTGFIRRIEPSIDRLLKPLLYDFYNDIIECSSTKETIECISDVLLDDLLKLPLSDFIDR